MTSETSAVPTFLSVRCEQRMYPPYDPFHGTPSPMLWRRIAIETAGGDAVFEQTDYGHPGKLNPWESRGIASPLLPKLALLRATVEAVAALL